MLDAEDWMSGEKEKGGIVLEESMRVWENNDLKKKEIKRKRKIR